MAVVISNSYGDCLSFGPNGMNNLWTSARMNPWFGPNPVLGNTCWDFAGKTNNEFVPTAVIAGSIAWETDAGAAPVAALPSMISADVGGLPPENWSS